MIFKDFDENPAEIIKKSSSANVMVWLQVRVKNFETTLEFEIFSPKLVWVRGYPQNQTGWSRDVWNDFYDHKRAEVAILRFSNSQKAILKDFEAKIEDFWDF